MWEYDWATPQRRSAVAGLARKESLFRPKSVQAIAPLFWEEHCIECAAPLCYTTCALYAPRLDGGCARFDGGIQRDRSARALLPYGAEIRFRRWGKLEARIPIGFTSPRQLKLLAAADRSITALVHSVAHLFGFRGAGRRILEAYNWRRGKWLASYGHMVEKWRDSEFVMEVWNLDSDTVDLTLEVSVEGIGIARQRIKVPPGHTLTRITGTDLGFERAPAGALLRLLPTGDAVPHLVFSWLDLVIPMPAAASIARGGTDEIRLSTFGTIEMSERLSAPYVKCIAWDLDGTLWDGTLLEMGQDSIEPRPGVIDMICSLDQRGILQTVVSKNDFDIAWSVLEKFGLTEYFLYPAISWAPKSESICAIADALDIGIDTFMLIDDSIFERAEVSQALPQVRVLDPVDLTGLLTRPELQFELSEEGRSRREQYRLQSQRIELASTFGPDLCGFLQSCKLQARVFVPKADVDITRCIELLQRSNQLNLSGRRYSRMAFVDSLSDPDVSWLAVQCNDHFGDYGLIGVARVDLAGAELRLGDLALSCRIAEKTLENAFIAWLRQLPHEFRWDRAAVGLVADFVPSSRNGRLFESLLRVGFSQGVASELHTDSVRLVLHPDLCIPDANIVAVVDELPKDHALRCWVSRSATDAGPESAPRV